MEEFLKNTKRIVVKIGSHLLEKNRDIDSDFIEDLSCQLKYLQEKGIETLLVSSGAVLAGIKKLGLKTKPRTVTEKQAVASVGQAYLMQIYDKIFSKKSLIIGQVLLTIEGLQERRRYILAQNTLNKLLEMNVIPVINENDTVAVEEIVFGDNDFLAAHVSVLVNADILIILSTAGGLYTKDPSEKDAQLISELIDIDYALKFAGSSKSKFGTGGMRSKLEAAKIATSHSIPVIIAPKEKGIVTRILSGEKVGTFIHPEIKKRSRKKSWIQTLSAAKGILKVDRGAEKAIKEGKSLLPAGIKDIEGIFSKNDVVAIQNEEGKIIGKGIVNYSYRELKKIKGLKSKEIEKILKKKFTEAIHRDNMVVFR